MIEKNEIVGHQKCLSQRLVTCVLPSLSEPAKQPVAISSKYARTCLAMLWILHFSGFPWQLTRMTMSSLTETWAINMCLYVEASFMVFHWIFENCLIYQKNLYENKNLHQKKYKISIKITKKCIVIRGSCYGSL